MGIKSKTKRVWTSSGETGRLVEPAGSKVGRKARADATRVGRATQRSAVRRQRRSGETSKRSAVTARRIVRRGMTSN
jgi:hypothetical protein